MKTYLTAALLAFILTVSASAQTAGDNNPKSPNRHHTRPSYSGSAKHHKNSQSRLAHSSSHKSHQPKPTSDHVVAH
jgi:hypothetical protein